MRKAMDGRERVAGLGAGALFHSPQPGVNFECRLDPSAGGTWAPCSSPKAYTALARGPHRFKVRAIDAAGNTDPSPPVRAFNIQA